MDLDNHSCVSARSAGDHLIFSWVSPKNSLIVFSPVMVWPDLRVSLGVWGGLVWLEDCSGTLSRVCSTEMRGFLYMLESNRRAVEEDERFKDASSAITLLFLRQN